MYLARYLVIHYFALETRNPGPSSAGPTPGRTYSGREGFWEAATQLSWVGGCGVWPGVRLDAYSRQQR